MAHSPDLFFSYVLERGNLGFLLLGLTRLGKPLFKKKMTSVILGREVKDFQNVIFLKLSSDWDLGPGTWE